MPQNKYETIFIAEPEITTEQVEELLSKIRSTITAHQGSVSSEDHWGRRRLAYSIRGHREGFYAVVNFSAEPAVVSALDHLYNVTGPVLRFLTVRQLEPSKKLEARRLRPAKASVSRRGPAHAGGSPRSHHEHDTRSAAPPAPVMASGHASEVPTSAPGAETSPEKETRSHE